MLFFTRECAHFVHIRLKRCNELIAFSHSNQIGAEEIYDRIGSFACSNQPTEQVTQIVPDSCAVVRVYASAMYWLPSEGGSGSTRWFGY